MSEPSAYAAVRDRVLRLMPLRLRRRWWFFTAYHRPLRLRRPVTFSEKMNWRIVNDRRRVLALTCDKVASKEFARDRCEGLSLRIPATYWIGTDLGELAQVELPPQWVLKPNHRSGLVIVGSGTPDLAKLRDQTVGWVDEWNWSMLGEWAYGLARQAIVVEERIGSGVLPSDYKVFVYDGIPRFIHVVEGRFVTQVQRFYSTAWEALPYESDSSLGPIRPRPDELTQLLEIAGRIGQGFDFMGVDLYVVDGEIWFGELSAYAHGGNRPSNSPGADAELGAFWRLPALSGTGPAGE